MSRDPRHILAHTRNLLIEQIVHCVGGNRNYRNQLEQMTDDQLREEWNKAIGEPMEKAGI